MKQLSVLDWIALVLVIIGAINFGLMGLFNLNLIDYIFPMSFLTRLIYDLIGLSGIYLIFVVGMLQKK